MNHYRLSDRARDDLETIWTFIATDSVRAADRLVRLFIQRFRTLANNPGAGRPRDELAPSLRSYPVGKYVIFYEPSAHGIEIVRVLSGFRDVSSQFE